MDTFLIKILVAVVYGVALGIVSVPLSKKLTLSRTDDPAKAAPLNKLSIKVLAIVLGVVSSLAIIFTVSDIDLVVRDFALLIPILSISLVDSLVRKIPNPLLLSMIIIELVYAAYHCVSTKSVEILPSIFIGFFIGMAVCYVPSMLKIPMGAGDIKYCAVIGLCVSAGGYFQAMILMGLLMALFLGYLKITKKGGLKTLVPMGPFLSAGTVVSMCFSILDLFGVQSILV